MTSTLTRPAPTGHGRLTAGLMLAAGSLFVVVPFIEFVAGEAFVLMGVAGLLVLLALPGVRRLQAGADGRPGSLGLRMMLVGLVVIVVLIFTGDPLDAALSGTAQALAEGLFAVLGVASVVALFLGVLSFSVGMLRARVFPRMAIWVFLAGMAAGLLAEAFEQSLTGQVPMAADLVPILGFMVAGVGMVLLGLAARRLADPAGAASPTSSLD